MSPCSLNHFLTSDFESGGHGVESLPARQVLSQNLDSEAMTGVTLGVTKDPGQAVTQDDDTTARFAAECPSFLRPSSMPGLCEPDSADNRLVAGSSLPGPTTQSCANPEFPVSAEYPRFSAVWGGCNRPFAVSAGNEDRPEADWGPSSLAPKSVSRISAPARRPWSMSR